MKFLSKLFLLTIGLVCLYSCEQDLNGQQLPGTETLTAEQIAATQEYAEFQKSMNDYSLAILTSDSQGFEDRLQELSDQDKLILPLQAEQFPLIKNAAVYATALNNLERELIVLRHKFDWQNLDHDFKMEIFDVYQAANPDVLSNKILNTIGIDSH